MQILCCTGSVTLNVMATGTHAHSGASNACTTSAGKWSSFTQGNFIPLSLVDHYSNVAHTVILILTMAGLFPDMPRIPLIYIDKSLFGKLASIAVKSTVT